MYVSSLAERRKLSISYFNACSQGVKIRRVEFRSRHGQMKSAERMWSVPQSYQIDMTTYTFKKRHSPPRLDYITINDVGARGYMFCWTTDVVHLAAYTGNQATLPYMYQQYDTWEAKWVYEPIDASEWVTDIWLRTRTPLNKFILIVG